MKYTIKPLYACHCGHDSFVIEGCPDDINRVQIKCNRCSAVVYETQSFMFEKETEKDIC